jgi:hypothetical protein
MCVTIQNVEAAAPLTKDSMCPGGACKGSCKRPPMAAALKALAIEERPAPELPIPVSENFATDILTPYRTQARYLKSAEITAFRDKAAIASGSEQSLATSRGRFAIPESCYIDDTGHFNAVEFNICYNQLAYVMFAALIEANLMHRLRVEKIDVPSIPEFKRQQLPAMLIVSLESRYYKQLDSKDFTGELTINKISPVGDAWFFFTTVTFADRDGIKAKGSVVLAFSPSYNPVKN